MKISKIKIHNFRSILDVEITTTNFLMFVGANNAGKSNVFAALRCFYDDVKWGQDDFPQIATNDTDSWVQISYVLTDNEWENLADKYKTNTSDKILTLRRYFSGEKVVAKQSNIHAIINDVEEPEMFYGAKNVSAAKCGEIIYIPALTTPSEQMKVTGPSPLKNILSVMLKKVVKKSGAFDGLEDAFTKFNDEAKKEYGFLKEIQTPINEALESWGVKLDFSISTIEADDIVKNLVTYTFIDSMLSGNGFELGRYGHGFQRAVIYELIKRASKLKDAVEIVKKEFNPCLTLILFEEPEVFLHPAQQEEMAMNLRELANDVNQQVFITSHSPIFVGKNSDNIGQICRVKKTNGISTIYQMPNNDPTCLFADNCDLVRMLQSYAESDECDLNTKQEIGKFLKGYSSDDVALQKDRFRFQLWLDTERASMFFAKKVLLVEGETEKALFNYLLSHNWRDLSSQHIFVVTALGKYNFYRYMSLFSYFGIPYGMIFDQDRNKKFHGVINKFLQEHQKECALGRPYLFEENVEKYLGVNVPERGEDKPLQILKLFDEHFSDEVKVKLEELKVIFCKVLAIDD